jgi:hypothetical protein
VTKSGVDINSSSCSCSLKSFVFRLEPDGVGLLCLVSQSGRLLPVWCQSMRTVLTLCVLFICMFGRATSTNVRPLAIVAGRTSVLGRWCHGRRFDVLRTLTRHLADTQFDLLTLIVFVVLDFVLGVVAQCLVFKP